MDLMSTANDWFLDWIIRTRHRWVNFVSLVCFVTSVLLHLTLFSFHSLLSSYLPFFSFLQFTSPLSSPQSSLALYLSREENRALWDRYNRKALISMSDNEALLFLLSQPKKEAWEKMKTKRKEKKKEKNRRKQRREREEEEEEEK